MTSTTNFRVEALLLQMLDVVPMQLKDLRLEAGVTRGKVKWEVRLLLITLPIRQYHREYASVF